MSTTIKLISKVLIVCLLVTILSAANAVTNPQPVQAAAETYSWGPLAGTDDLGRTLSDYSTAGQPRYDRTVGMFYFPLHGASNDLGEYKYIVNFEEALAIDPNSPLNYASPLWPDASHMGYWGKPLYGYYRSDDKWVLRKQMQLLGNAGVDYLVIDVTNIEAYVGNVNLLMQVIEDIQRQGGKTPQVAFMAHTGATQRMDDLYAAFYAPDAPYRHPSTWFYWKGKPLMIGEAPSATISNFFTFRHAQWPNEPRDAKNGWDWISFDRPQRMNYSDKPAEPIIDDRNAAVSYTGTWALSAAADAYNGTEKTSSTANSGVSYNFTGTSIAFIGSKQPGGGYANVWIDGTLMAYNINLNAPVRMPKQMLYTITGMTSGSHTILVGVGSGGGTVAIDGFSTVTSGKEQMAVSVAQNSGGIFSYTAFYNLVNPPSRSRSYHNGAEDNAANAVNYGYNFQEEWNYAIAQDPETLLVLGWNEWSAGNWQNSSRTNPICLYDLCSMRWSRDIEPMLGGYGDNYYMQLADNIRKYKGIEVPAAPGPSKTITVNTSFSQWADVTPAFKDYTGDTADRSFAGTDNKFYRDTSGRNDIDVTKIARDANNVYFYVKTVDNITPYTDSNWMTLYLNVDGNGTNGWKGYDYAINRTTPGSSTACTLESSSGGWNWTPVTTDISYSVSGNQMMLKIPRSYLGNLADPLNIEFKWADNWQNNDDVMDFYLHGDTAPDARFNYIYTTGNLPVPIATKAPQATPGPSPTPKPDGYYKVENNDRINEYMAYNASWATASDSAASGSSYAYLSNPNGSTNTHIYYKNWIRSSFTGNGVRWISVKAPDGTQAEVYIDGLSQGIVSLYSPTVKKQEIAFEKYGLEEGQHEISVRFLFQNGTYYHDAFEYKVGNANIARSYGENLAIRANATATSFATARYYPMNPGQANDNSTGTYWKADGTGGQKLYLDFGSVVKVDKVQFIQNTNISQIGSYKVLYWNETAQAWNTAYTSSENMSADQLCSFSRVTTRKVALEVDSMVSGTPAIYEMRAFYPAEEEQAAVGLKTLGSNDDTPGGNNICATRVTASQSIIAANLNLYIASGAAGYVRMGIYTDNSGSPGTLLAQTSSIAAANGWLTGSIPDTALTSGTNYWLVFIFSQTGSHTRYNSSGALKWASYTYGALPSTAPAMTGSNTATYSFYASGYAAGLDKLGSTNDTPAGNSFCANKVTVDRNIAVTRLNLYIAGNATGTARMGIYTNNNGAPGTLLAQTEDIMLANGWNTGSIASTNLVSGTDYWLVFNLSRTGSITKYNASGTLKYNASSYGALPATAPALAYTIAATYSMYAGN